MRRSALPSYASDGRRAAPSTAAAAAPAGRWHTRWWLLFYAMLGFYALAVLGYFVLGWAPQPPAPQQQLQQVLVHHQLTVVDAGPVKVDTTDPNEPEEGWPAQDPNESETEEKEMQRELEQQQQQGAVIGANDEENAAAVPLEVTTPVVSELAKETPSPTTTAPATTSPSTPEEQIATEKNVEIPPRQNDVVLLAVNEEKAKEEEATTEPSETKAADEEGDAVKDPNQAEAEMQAPQEKWEVEDSAKQEAAETPGPLVTPMSYVTRAPVRRSHEFLQAMDLVHLPETKPPNQHFHVFPVGKDLAGEQAALVSGLRNNAADRDAWSVEGYQHELDRLEGLKNEAKEETERLKLLMGATDKLIAEEKDRLEDKRAASTLDIRQHQPRMIRNRLKCMGWRQTGQCDPYGKREPNADLACNQIAQGGVSGYCEVMDEDTGELFRVMQLNCSSVRDHVVFSCAEAADFANFGLMAQGVYENALAQNESNPAKLLGNNGTGNGIVMVVYPKLLSSAFASISVLRSYNCTLPIELWISQPEVVRTPSMRTTLELLQQRFANVTVETIIDPTVAGFSTKIHAVQHSKFENVLFLDADNVPVRDPTFLFESHEFHEHGAIFWPDFWHPEKTIFNIQRESLLWELVDLPFVDMFEQESGQILINRKRAALALEVLMFYAYHRPSHFERLVLAHGDKDLFRLAWMKTRTPYYMMPFPPAAAGVERGTYKKLFCGMTMVQFDVDGNVLFLHRNAKKLDGKVDKMDPKYWTHLQSFKWEKEVSVGEEIMFPANRTAVQRMMSYEDIKKKYQIGIQPSGALFKEFESCYGAEANVIGNYNLTKFEELPFANLEQELIAYAHEGALLMAQAQGRLGVP
ncbi:Vesicle transport protein [Phytophthora cinnamomi]|uniref:Vesicle transport protein n=1 Tax=Phytophthora cinnamomi TaxID=4785 RepID=UPI00355A8D69|nr:Vesicle transport protein [Phytophthora cinnamomi]